MRRALEGHGGFSSAVSDQQLARLARVVHERAGIVLGPDKRALVEARLRRVLERRSLPDVRALLLALDDDADGALLTELLDAVSTNHTFFFREGAHFDWITGAFLPGALRDRGGRPLRVWSAAASTGAEAYSVAIALTEALEPLRAAVPLELLGTDISTRALAAAREGIYPVSAVRGVAPARLRRWFQRGVGAREGMVRVRPEARRLVTFERANLVEGPLPQGPFDLVLLRNVLIYFDGPTQGRVAERVARAVGDGGALLVGHSETLARLPAGLDRISATTFVRRALRRAA